jgi:hypothetical protein
MFERGGYTHSEMTENMMAAQQAGNASEEAVNSVRLAAYTKKGSRLETRKPLILND